MRDRLSWLAQRAGRRGAFLAFLAILDLGYGYSLLATPAPQRPFDLLLPWEMWGWIWVTAAIITGSGILARRDRYQFAFSAAFKFCWAALSAELWLGQHLPRGWVGVVIWAAFAAVVLLVAGWPEPLRVPANPEPGPPEGGQ